MPLSVLIVLGLFGIYLIMRGNAGVREQVRAQARMDEDPDGVTLDELAHAGSDLTREHEVEFYLYFPDEARANMVASVLQGEGYTTQVHLIEGASDWTLLASRVMKPELAPLRAARERLAPLAESHGGTYDGWGTEVEGEPDAS